MNTGKTAGRPRVDAKQKGNHNANLEKDSQRVQLNKYARKRQRSRSLAVTMTPKRVKDLFTELITIHGHPFSMLDAEAFRELLTELLEAANLAEECKFSAAAVRIWVMEKATDMRLVIRKELKGKLISLKVDSATRHNRGFIGINVQFLEDGVFHVRTLGVLKLLQKHSADYLKETIMKTLKKFEIDISSIYSFTSDNGTNLVSKLFHEEQLQLIEGSDIYEEQDPEESIGLPEKEPLGINQPQFCALYGEGSSLISNVRCSADIFQLSVEDALTKEKDSKKIFAKARTVIKALRTPTILNELTRSDPKAKKPRLNVVTSWDSTADMLESLMEYKDCCRKFSKKFQVLELSDSEWQYIEDYLKALMPARIASKRLEDEHLTLGSFFGIWLNCKLDTEEMNTPLAVELVAAMERREKELFENDAFLASVYLDPRFLSLLSNEQRSIAVARLKKLWEIIEELHNRTAEVLRMERQARSEVSHYRVSDRLRRMMSEVAAAQRLNAPGPSYIEQLLEKFARMAGTVDLDDDIVYYWESKKAAMSELYQLATIVHAAPASQVTVERLFSGMKFIFSNLRGNLKPETLDDIMVIRCNSQNGTRAQGMLSESTERCQRRRTEEHM